MQAAKITKQIKVWWRKASSVAYMPECCTAHVALAHSTVFHRCYERTQEVAAIVFEGDILAALDNAKPKHVSIAFSEMGVPPLAIAAFLNEQKGMMVKPDFQGLECGEDAKMNA